MVKVMAYLSLNHYYSWEIFEGLSKFIIQGVLQTQYSTEIICGFDELT